MQNARKLRAWFWIWRVFGTNSHLNETARFGKNDAVSSTVHAKKKKRKEEEAKMVSFWTAPYVFFFPWTREAGEEEDFFSSSVFHRHLSLKKTLTNPTCPKLSTCWRRGRRCVPRAVFGVAAQWPPPASLSPVFPINTRESTRKKEGAEKTEERGQRKR